MPVATPTPVPAKQRSVIFFEVLELRLFLHGTRHEHCGGSGGKVVLGAAVGVVVVMVVVGAVGVVKWLGMG